MPYASSSGPLTPELVELALEWARILRPSWPERSAGIPGWHPRLEDDDDAGDGAGDADDDDDAGDGADDSDTDDDVSELAKAQRAAAAANRELRKLKATAQRDADKAKREAGRFEELYNETKAELDELKAEAANGAKRTLVEAALRTAKAKNPTRATRLVDLEDIEDDRDAERAVKRLVKSDPYLFDTAPTRQKRGAGGTSKSNDDDDDDDDAPRRPKPRRKLDWTAPVA